MIAIGQALGIEVIAQGVESEEQANVLRAQGCRVIQGFYSGRPVSADVLHGLARTTTA
jgi:EAL domain-containing protein (putative c-di-GMP-specific phosphodiesterase class I)